MIMQKQMQKFSIVDAWIHLKALLWSRLRSWYEYLDLLEQCIVFTLFST